MEAPDSLFSLCRHDPEGVVDLVTRMKDFPAELKALIGFRDEKGVTPLFVASENGHHQAVDALLTAGADKDAPNNAGWTPLHLASQNGHHQVVEALLLAGANKDAANNHGATPLYIASGKGYRQIEEALLAAGADKGASTSQGWTPLHIAAQHGHPQVVEVLLLVGADMHATTNAGSTPLFIASLNGHHQVVEMLLAAGADTDAVNQNGTAPLFVASMNGHHQVVEMLLAAGADKNAVKTDKWRPLHIASRYGHRQVVELLLAAGADKDAVQTDRWTPLHLASWNGHHRVVELLLAAGADKEAVTCDGQTPLFVASQNGHHQVVEHLLSVGADETPVFSGQSPLDVARIHQHSKVVSLLSSATRPSPSPLIAASLTNFNRVKLMLLGRAAVGKSTLVRALFGKQPDLALPATNGIDLGQFSAGGIEFMTWDFGGPKVFRYTHQLFLSSHAVYLILFKVSDPMAESLKEARFWLNSISARVSDSVVLLVATHADKVDPRVAESRAQELSQSVTKEYPSLLPFGHRVSVISATSPHRSAFKDLLDDIVRAGRSVILPAPKNFASTLSYLLELRLSPPVIELHSAIMSLQAMPSVGHSEPHILRLLRAFHTFGLIAVFQNEELPSRGVIVLRPQWAARLLATIVTTAHDFVNRSTGLLPHRVLVSRLWADHTQFPPERHCDLIDLLMQLDIFFPDGQSTARKGYFVPCMLREEAPDLGFYLPPELSQATLHLHRVMELECAVPISVIPPIMVELMGYGELRARWQQGCVVRISASRPGMQDQVWLQLWRSGGRKLELKLWGESIQTVTHWLQRVGSRIDGRLRAFYHVGYKTRLPCRDCLSADPSSDGHFSLDDLRDSVLKAQSDACCQPDILHCWRLDSLVPDMLFLDLGSRGFVVPSEYLAETSELGQGAPGKVLKVSVSIPASVDGSDTTRKGPASNVPTCSSRQSASANSSTPSLTQAVETRTVAVRYLDSREDAWPDNGLGGSFFEKFKQEVYLMSSLDDPNLVKLQGICLNPRFAMLMEMVEGGDLYGQLNDPFRLQSRVFGLVKLLNAAFSEFNMNQAQMNTFRHVFLNRGKLAADDRRQLETRIVRLLSEPRDDAIGWIQQQYDQGLDTTEISRLNDTNPVTQLGITAGQLETLGFKLPVLETLGNWALEKARRGFREWKENVSECGTSGLVEAIESWEQRFFAAVQELYGMWARQASTNDFKLMNEGMIEIEDGIGRLSREHALLVAPVDEAMRLKLAIDISRGVVRLHELNPPIAHRDLKTPNIFLTRSLRNFPALENDGDDESWGTPLAKVGDFGLSLLSMQSQFQIRDRAEDGTLHDLDPTWAAPELLNGQRSSTSVDVYAMGIILWELLFRTHPFSDVPLECVRGQVISGLRPALPAAVAGDPNLREYIELMTRSWHQNPAMRPSMREVYSSLRGICQTRCPSLSAKLLPPPALRAVGSRLEHDEPELKRAASVTSHSFAVPAGRVGRSATQVPQVACMLAPLKQQEVLWLGLESGHVAMVDYRHGQSLREMLRWTQCQKADRHQQRVNAICHVCTSSEEEVGTVWTGSEDGSIHVWSPQLRSLEEIYDVNTLKGRLEYLSRFLFIERFATCWIECENGALTWYAKRHDLSPILSLPVSSIRSISMPDARSLSVGDSSGKTHEFRQPDDDPGNCGVAEWHRVLSNLLNASASSARGITRLASQRQSQQAILALEGTDHTVWSANAAFLLTEWGLDSTVNHHGLHRMMQLRPLRNVQLDGNRLPARMRAIGGFVRAAASVLWVAVGDRWVVLDVSAEKATIEAKWQEAMVEGMDKIATLFSVWTEGGQEVWTIDLDGRRFVWRCGDAENPQVAGELVDEGWGEEQDGRGYCMAQVGRRQVWVGTSRGRVLSWDISSRHLVNQQRQPLPASHPLAHGRSVHALVSISGAHPPVVWSASRDHTLRRFSW